MGTLLDVEGLNVSFVHNGARTHVVKGTDFRLASGETLGIVGESGSGKSVTSLSLMRLLPTNAEITAKTMRMGDTDILSIPKKVLPRFRGSEISMVFQDPMTSLDPVFTIEKQITETIEAHQQVSHSQARKKALELLELVEIPNAKERISMYPFEFSGGMRQRVVIAIAIACNPKLLIADEPTTALDVTVQAQIIALFKKIQREIGMSIIFITHDLGVIWETCQNMMVMYNGVEVEYGSTKQIYTAPQHPYTQGFLAAQVNQAIAPGKPLQTIDYSTFSKDILNDPDTPMLEYEPGHRYLSYTAG
ncbi:ABC transporter ATP-binding protein [Bifidobacterium sp.]|jgi:peptide/nickel transport system ATP-binding protein/oligopeptide transport system ATP-binding protein|uniref:ABC transporter ATP-binding protein n=1 Tax=Bifidobacterium sp. TaxID=41200 RepID=UPI0025C561D1|nr:ABC transporter ATP-binding protein [Bifidobacterium sp.]MCH4209713.1 ABC transporter ATP-binding protein [Bifidobacterium sp.]MCI1224517.1 ABC transporter ATP-binding protein [Bifidobacterium sp.]